MKPLEMPRWIPAILTGLARGPPLSLLCFTFYRPIIINERERDVNTVYSVYSFFLS